MRRNNQRAGKSKIPPAALAGTLKKLQPPTVNEGFSKVHTVEISAENQFVVT
jgi:hypothetical protein